MSERSIQAAIIKELRRLNCYVVNQTAAEAGVPDLLVCLPDGRFAGLEVKQPGSYATPLQRHHLEQIKNAGGIAAVVRSVADAVRECELRSNEHVMETA